MNTDHSTRYHSMDDYFATEDMLSQVLEDNLFKQYCPLQGACAILTKEVNDD